MCALAVRAGRPSLLGTAARGDAAPVRGFVLLVRRGSSSEQRCAASRRREQRQTFLSCYSGRGDKDMGPGTSQSGQGKSKIDEPAWCSGPIGRQRQILRRRRYISHPPPPTFLCRSLPRRPPPSPLAPSPQSPLASPHAHGSMSTPITQEMVDSTLERRNSRSSGSRDSLAKVDPTNVAAEVRVNDPEKATHTSAALEDEEEVSPLTRAYRRFRPVVLAALAALILGWWVSATVLKDTRHRWCARSLPAFFLDRHA